MLTNALIFGYQIVVLAGFSVYSNTEDVHFPTGNEIELSHLTGVVWQSHHLTKVNGVVHFVKLGGDGRYRSSVPMVIPKLCR